MSAQQKTARKPGEQGSAPESRTPLLDGIRGPTDLRNRSIEQLAALADELRAELIETVSETGGHLGANLGVVELTLALHAVFDTPRDRLIWDVGHQAYPHKILTGRRERMRTLRQGGGLSGFTKRTESEYDPFGAGHSSTSVSAGLGMAAARDLKGDDERAVICVIGDGALSAGMAYEALNNAGELGARLIVILNDNRMSIAPATGAMSRYLTRLVSSRPYVGAREAAKRLAALLPEPLRKAARAAEETARAAMGGGTLFEEMGFYYIGPIDGHDVGQLVPVLRNVRDMERGPVLVHVVTHKGKGYAPAEDADDKMHGVARFDAATGRQNRPAAQAPSYTKVFSQALGDAARSDKKILAITAAMPAGTGLDAFAAEFPDRFFDVGIAEQHAVTFAAGLAAEGMKPFVAIYSTFLQRAYDQIVHDVAIQNLPVRFAIDRAGLVGADGATHAGMFDTAFLGCLPNMVLMAAGDGADLARMVATAAAYDFGPIAFRYPRGDVPDSASDFSDAKPLEIGRGRILLQGDGPAILNYGARLCDCLRAAEFLARKNIAASVADARFAKPLDESLIEQLARHHEKLVIVEDGTVGGFGSYVLDFLNGRGLLDRCRVRTLRLPDRFQDHDSPEKQYAQAGLDAEHIAKAASS